MLVVDTSVLVEHLRGNKTVTRFLKAQDTIIAPALVAWELWKRAQTPRQRAAVQAVLAMCRVEPFSASHAELAGTIHGEVAGRGRKRPVLDLLISSHALEHGCAVATLDGDYSGITGLKIIKPK